MKASFTLLSIDIPDEWQDPIRAAFQSANGYWLQANSRPEAERILANIRVDAIISPILALALAPLEIIPWIHERLPDVPVIIVSDNPSENLSEDAQKIGATDFILLSDLTPLIENSSGAADTQSPQPSPTAPKPNRQTDSLTNQLFNQLVALSPSVIFTCAPVDKFPYRSVSANLKTLTGYPVEAFLGDVNFWYSHIHPDDLGHVEKISAQIFSQVVIHFDYRFLHQSGNYIWLHDEWRAVYSDTGEIKEIIGSTIDITRLKEAQSDLQERLRFEELLASLITQFITAPREQIDEAITYILTELGHYLHSDSTFFYLISEDGSELTDTYEWQKDQSEFIRHRFKGLPLASFPWSIHQLMSGQNLLIDRVSDLPDEAIPERDRWLSQGLQAMLAIPILSHHRLIGFFGASSVSPSPHWQTVDLVPFLLVRDAFASVWIRIDTEEQLRESEERFRLLAENSSDVISLHEILSNRILYISPSCTRLTGFRPEEMLGHQPKEFIPLDDWLKVKAGFARMLKANLDSAVFEYHFLHKSEGPFWVETTIQAIRDSVGEMIHYVSVTRDITRRKADQEALLNAQNQLTLQISELARRAQELATLSEMGNMLQVCSQLDEACNVIAQFSPNLFPGTSGYIATLVGKTNELEVHQKWGQPALIARRFRTNECWGIRRSRPTLKENPAIGTNCGHFESPLPASYLCIPITSHSRPVALLHLQADSPGILTESQFQLAATTAEQIGLGLTNLELRQSLTERTRTDPLTGILSRSFLEERLEVEFARACTTIQPLSLILIDIDHFREVNAALGHFQADQVLISLAETIQSTLEKEDVIGRFGGDEFIILLPNTQLEAAYLRAEKLRTKIRSSLLANNHPSQRPLTISAGVACWPTHGESPTVLVRAVTLALEEAKKLRDQVALANLPSRPVS